MNRKGEKETVVGGGGFLPKYGIIHSLSVKYFYRVCDVDRIITTSIFNTSIKREL
jgi:hypothetical protein